jgi:hypothetical protein
MGASSRVGWANKLAVANSDRTNVGGLHRTARGDTLAAILSRKAWNRYSAGDGARGRHEFDWVRIAIIPPTDQATGYHRIPLTAHPPPHSRR